MIPVKFGLAYKKVYQKNRQKRPFGNAIFGLHAYVTVKRQSHKHKSNRHQCLLLTDSKSKFWREKMTKPKAKKPAPYFYEGPPPEQAGEARG